VQSPSGSAGRSATNVRRRKGAIGKAGSRPFGDDGTDGVDWPAAPTDVNLRKIFFLLRSKTGVDFSLYRANTVRRRLQRRITVTKTHGLNDYVGYLRRFPAEVESLYSDLLIHVTSFFRNPSVYDMLKRKIFPKIAKHHTDMSPVRIWVAGCSTGQEAYSLAIAYAEFVAVSPTKVPLQIFATDISTEALDFGRTGRYSEAEVAGINRQRLKRFFVEENGKYRVIKSIRDRIVFAQQNLLSQPPFTKMDLISCRNVMIYIETSMQQKLIPTFHYALAPGGYLLLGTSETVGQNANLFKPVERPHKIYRKVPVASWAREGRPPLLPSAKPLPNFHPSDAAPLPRAKKAPAGARGQPEPRIDPKAPIPSTLASLRDEFVQNRERLAVLQSAHDVSLEELQSSNEEVQSSNEELQSLNEELETSNEELESTNEELTTLNEELATRNDELRESERLLREQAQLLELAPVLVRSPKDRIVYWNRGAEKMYGFTKEEALGHLSHLLLGAQFPEPLEQVQAKLARDGRWEGEVVHRRKDGSMLSVAAQWVVHYDESGKIRAVLEINTDVSSRKQAEEALRTSESFNRSILDSSPDSICLLDHAGRIKFMTPAAMALMDITDFGSVANAFWPSLWERESRPEAENAFRNAMDGQPARFQAPNRTAASRLRWWDVAIRPVDTGPAGAQRLLVVSRDITDLKKAEEAALERTRLVSFRGETAAVIARAESLPIALQRIAELLVRHIGVAFARFWLLRPGSEVLELCASAGLYTHLNGAHARVAVGQFKIGRIAANKVPHLTNDVANDPEISDPEWARAESMVAFAGYPLIVSGQVVGVLGMFSRQSLDPIILEELALSVETTSLFVARKFAEEEQGRLFDAAMAARSEVELLNEIGRTIAAELDGEKLTAAVVDAAIRLTRAEYGIFAPATGLTEPVRSDDLNRDPRFPHGAGTHGMPPAHRALQSYLAVPVISRTGDVLGGLFFGHSLPGAFGERDERLVVGLAAQASVAMDNAHIFDQLERKVEERTARLRETISELQAFSYTVSHDLRAPLRAMQSYAEALKEDFGDKMDPGAMTYLTRIELAGYRLDRLIQDVLTYSRISQGGGQLHPVSLAKLVREIVEQYPNLAAAQGSIHVEGELPRVLAEESPATQCLSNLLGNALKFIPKDRTPSVRIYAEERGAMIRLWIADNGIGIAPADQERIFRMFERVGNEQEYEGTGIGLAIVRKAMERMGGAAGVESKLGEGSKFWLDFRKQ